MLYIFISSPFLLLLKNYIKYVTEGVLHNVLVTSIPTDFKRGYIVFSGGHCCCPTFRLDYTSGIPLLPSLLTWQVDLSHCRLSALLVGSHLTHIDHSGEALPSYWWTRPQVCSLIGRCGPPCSSRRDARPLTAGGSFLPPHKNIP